jgi:hypothetical protein
MKKILVFLFAIALFASCKNVEQYKTGITDLTTKWDAATTTVTELSTMLEASKAAQMASFDSLHIDSTFLSKLKGADLEKVNAAVTAYQSSGAGLTEATTKLAEIKSTWDAKSTEVSALKDGLAAGKLEGDVAAKITELTTFITNSEATVTSIKDIIAKSSEGSTSALATLKTAVAPFMGKN